MLPVFVKPCKSGSSIGVSKINKWDDLSTACERAFNEDDEIIVEEQIDGKLFSFCVFRTRNNVHVTPVMRYEFSGSKEYLDMEAKTHRSENVNRIFETNGEIEAKLRSFGMSVFKLFGDKGLFRIDTIIRSTDHEPYLLEVNSIPGMSEDSKSNRSGLCSAVVCRQLQCGFVFHIHRHGFELPGDGGALVHFERLVGDIAFDACLGL